MPTPEVADGHVNAMPAMTVDTCYGERRSNKARILSKSEGNLIDGQDVPLPIVTPRLSKPTAIPPKNFSISSNALNCSHMDRYKESTPNMHQQLTQQLQTDKKNVEQELAVALTIA